MVGLLFPIADFTEKCVDEDISILEATTLWYTSYDFFHGYRKNRLFPPQERCLLLT